MKTFLAHFRDIAISGFFALFPMYVLFIVITKAWTSFTSVGTKMAGMFGLKSILGVGGTTVFSAPVSRLVSMVGIFGFVMSPPSHWLRQQLVGDSSPNTGKGLVKL